MNSAPLLTKAAPKVSLWFYISVFVSALGAFVFGFSLGYTSPTFLAHYSGVPGDAEKECVLCVPGLNPKKCATEDECSSFGGTWDAGGKYCNYKQDKCEKMINSSKICGSDEQKATWNDHYDFCAGAHAKGQMNCELNLSDDTSSWFGSLINIGCLVGALSGGSIADRIGKKLGMMIAYAFYILGWVLICFAPRDLTSVDNSTILAMLYASRLSIGFAIGIICCTVSNYQTESCPTAMRGLIGTVFQIAIVLGLLMAYLIGLVLDNWLALAWIMLVSSSVGLVSTFVLQETPVFLLLQDKIPEAQLVLQKLRVGDVTAEFAELKGSKGGTELEGTQASAPEGNPCAVLFGGGVATKALLIGIGLMFVQQLSGINAVMFYCGTILQSVFTPSVANTYAVGIQGMQVVLTIVSAPLMDKAGRIPILLFAALGQCCACGLLGVYYLTIQCEDDGPMSNDLHPHGSGSGSPASDVTSDYFSYHDSNGFTLADTFVPEFDADVTSGYPDFDPCAKQNSCTPKLPKALAVVGLYAYVGFFSCGMGAIPWFLMGEIFPAEVKGLASSVATGINWSLSLFITKTVGLLTTSFNTAGGHGPNDPQGMGGVFLAYGAVCLLGAVFVKSCIPETKGKTFEQIQTELAGGGRSASGRPRASYQDKSYQW